MRLKIATLILLLTCCLLVDSVAGQTMAFVDATIETADKSGTLEDGIMVVDGDKIVDIGKDVTIPDDAQVISLQGKYIMPGIVDPYYVFSTTGAAQSFRTIVFRGRTIRIPHDPPPRLRRLPKLENTFTRFRTASSRRCELESQLRTSFRQDEACLPLQTSQVKRP